MFEIFDRDRIAEQNIGRVCDNDKYNTTSNITSSSLYSYVEFKKSFIFCTIFLNAMIEKVSNNNY